MSCLTDEQATRMALNLPEGADEAMRLKEHLKECPACRSKLANSRRLVEQLSAAHHASDQNHAALRARLLAALPSIDVARQPPYRSKRLVVNLGGLTMRQRIAAVGVGVSALAAVALIFLMLNTGHQLSAMERMCKELNALTSYSYTGTEHVTYQNKQMTEPGIVDLSQSVYWRAPAAFREELKITLSGNVPRGYEKGQAYCDIVSISLTNKPGLFVDRLARTYTHESKLRPEDTGSGSLTYPNPFIKMIREEPGKIAKDLGARKINGKEAHGYAMVYPHDTDPIEVWLDPQTDLPVEIDRTLKDESTTSVEQYSDFRWNIDLDPTLFDTTPPAGYTDITPPDDAKALAGITAALRLYAELSGGHYPRIDTEKVNEKFDAEAIYAEMLKMAGFSGTPQPQWGQDSKFRELEQTKAGLDWIAKITRAKATTRYDGLHVTPQDKDKVLLWWLPGRATEGYRVYYGDLQTRKLTKAEAEKVILPGPKLWDESAERTVTPAEGK